MKRISYITMFLFTVLLSGCTADCEVPDTAVPLLSVTITVGGFSYDDNGAPTRAADAEYTTTFVKDDQVGIFAVADDGVVLDNNVPYQYDGINWVPVDASNTIHNYNYAGVTYFAYYPYSPTMDDAKSENEVIGKFTPQENQSTHDAYTASDLMTGVGVVSDAGTASPAMKLTLKHRMSLIVIDVKSNTYVTTGGYEYSEPVVCNSITVAGADMLQWGYCSSVATYKYIVLPATTARPVIINYNAGRINEEYNISLSLPQTITGKYHLINTHRGSKIRRDLQIGDFYYQDGAILPKDSAFYNFAANSCIGIVYQVGVERDDNLAGYNDKLSVIRGYVVGLQQVNSTWGDQSRVFGIGGAGYAAQGYKSTQMIMKAASEEGKNFPACSWCVNNNPAPTGITSGWYFPATGQVRDLVNRYATINPQLAQISGAIQINSGLTYSSSSETTTTQVWGVRSNTGGWSYLGKGNSYPIRAVLTF